MVGMKNLVDVMKFVSKDTIYEKLDINKVNLNDTGSFPIDGSIEDMIKFLKSLGFKEIDVKGRSATESFNSKHDKCYWLRDKLWIYFGDTSEGNISPTNELFMIIVSKSGSREYRIINNYSCSNDYRNNTKAFLKILNKQFGWV